MRISSLRLTNFKRFTDLTVENIPADTKLVLLIGSNGSGKSSVFDAFRCAQINSMVISNYYAKNNFEPTILIKDHSERPFIYSYNEGSNHSKGAANSLYGRTSFRHLPRLTQTRSATKMKSVSLEEESQFINKDNLFEIDIDTISERVIRDVFINKSSSEEIQFNYIKPINAAFENIFGKEGATKLAIYEIIPPFENKVAQINFRKGKSEIHYDLLSAGEKEIVNILFNLFVRRDQYSNTVYFLDELDLHLNTKLQYNLIKEITENWIPENCQLWTASHSLGFIDYASESKHAVILDFDDLDFDQTQVIRPSDSNNYQIFELAVGRDFAKKVFQDKKIIFSENTDTPIYNDLSIENTFFFNAIDKKDVFEKSKNLKTIGLVDRDYLSDDEIIDIKTIYPFLRILPYYSIENLLFHPDNLNEYYSSIGKDYNKEHYISELTKEKNQHKDFILFGIAKARDGYPFYKENDPETHKRLKDFKESGKDLVEMIKSDDFEVFYKIFPAKDYGKKILERQNLSKNILGQTKWFRNQIVAIIEN